MITIKLLVAITWLPFIVSQDNIGTDNELNLDETEEGFTVCNTKNGTFGLCVREGWCSEDHYILPGGDIHESEHRSLDNQASCNVLDWCCSVEKLDLDLVSQLVKNNTNITSDNCEPLKDDRCPWCVKLYKVLDLNTDSGAFCIGSLVSSNVIMTAASCLTAAQHYTLYARIPTSADPDHKYIVKERILHPQYNGGTHWFDYGIIVLNEDVNWGVNPQKRPCLNFALINGRCFTLGYDSKDEFVSTRLKVSQGRCSNLGGGGSTDVFCGTSTEDICFATIGAPVICESDSGFVMQGIVRADCEEDNVLLGSLTYAVSWITKELEAKHAIQPLPVLRSSDQNACQPLHNDKCPWCVKLYKVSPLNSMDSGVFCIGSLIGANIIMTAASCLSATQHYTLYARIPTSAEPDHKYTVKERKLHPQYNGGINGFDYGIIVLDEEVNWGVTPARGACLNFEQISGRCFTLGYNTKDEFVSTILSVSKGPCSISGGGDSPDVFCGTSRENSCFADPGAPVICETSSGGLVLQGVVRSPCEQNNLLIGSLNSASSWITTELEGLKVSKEIYTQN